MNYYEIYDADTGILLAKGTARECKEKLGCASIDSFYALANRSIRRINRKYKVIRLKGPQTDYPVLGKDDPMYKEYQRKNRIDDQSD